MASLPWCYSLLRHSESVCWRWNDDWSSSFRRLTDVKRKIDLMILRPRNHSSLMFCCAVRLFVATMPPLLLLFQNKQQDCSCLGMKKFVQWLLCLCSVGRGWKRQPAQPSASVFELWLANSPPADQSTTSSLR